MREHEADYRTLSAARLGKGKTSVSMSMTKEVRRLVELIAVRGGMTLRGVVETAIKEMAERHGISAEPEFRYGAEGVADAAEQGGAGLGS